MAELAYLGALLGMPNILDPAFPLAYTAFFGSIPVSSEEQKEPGMGLGQGAIKVEPGEEQQAHDPTYVHPTNVSGATCTCVRISSRRGWGEGGGAIKDSPGFLRIKHSTQ